MEKTCLVGLGLAPKQTRKPCTNPKPGFLGRSGKAELSRTLGVGEGPGDPKKKTHLFDPPLADQLWKIKDYSKVYVILRGGGGGYNEGLHKPKEDAGTIEPERGQHPAKTVTRISLAPCLCLFSAQRKQSSHFPLTSITKTLSTHRLYPA